MKSSAYCGSSEMYADDASVIMCVETDSDTMTFLEPKDDSIVAIPRRWLRDHRPWRCTRPHLPGPAAVGSRIEPSTDARRHSRQCRCPPPPRHRGRLRPRHVGAVGSQGTASRETHRPLTTWRRCPRSGSWNTLTAAEGSPYSVGMPPLKQVDKRKQSWRHVEVELGVTDNGTVSSLRDSARGSPHSSPSPQ